MPALAASPGFSCCSNRALCSGGGSQQPMTTPAFLGPAAETRINSASTCILLFQNPNLGCINKISTWRKTEKSLLLPRSVILGSVCSHCLQLSGLRTVPRFHLYLVQLVPRIYTALGCCSLNSSCSVPSPYSNQSPGLMHSWKVRSRSLSSWQQGTNT